MLVLAAGAAGLSALHCGDSGDDDARRETTNRDGDDAGATFLPFEAVAPASYVAKVKNILTGLPPTADEVGAVVANPGALRGLVDRWVETPEAKAKLVGFFSNAFQQTQFVPEDFEDQLGGMTDAPDAIIPNLREAFARTALAFTEQDRAFSEVTTTRSFMMTTALMSFYGFIDVRRRDDKANDRDKLHDENPDWSWMAIDSAKRQIPFTSSIDPNSPDYLTFSVPWSKCMPRTYTKYQTTSTHLMLLLFGTLSKGAGPANCNQAGVRDLPMLFAPSDFSDWRMVTIRAPDAGKQKQRFYDLPALRSSNELVVDLPRVGFFTTPAFFANWGTNVNNLARVTTNQTLIVALGKSFLPQGPAPVSESGLDTEHADKTTVCYGCHRRLDPMRLFFRKTYSLMYHEQDNPTEQAVTPAFSFYGVDSPGSTMDDLGAILAHHPSFPIAWAQKLCTYADSAPCSEDDPEFLRIVEAFKASGLHFKTLIGELFSSPLVTGAARTKTFDDREVVVSIARHDHFCTAMHNRLGIDACNLPMAPRGQSELAGRLSSNIPGDGYSRGAETTNLTTAPGLFVRSTVENLCDVVSQQVVDGPAPSKYTSADKDGAIADFVSNLMALTSSDPRAAGIRQILGEHYQAVVQGGGTPTDALRSTFVLTCVSPLVTGIGL